MRKLLAVAASLFLTVSPLAAGTPDPTETVVGFNYSANFIDMVIIVQNAQGNPVTTPLTISVTHAAGSAGLSAIGPVLDTGGGLYTASLLPASGQGIDIFEVAIDDGNTITIVAPNPGVCIGDIAGGLSQDCNGNFIPDECEILTGIAADANANDIPDDCESFRRGDCNADQVYDFLDILHQLNYLFGDSGLTLECADACDGDDDGSIDVHDVVVIIQAFFAAGPGIAQPFPDCGLDPTADNLSCDIYAVCP